MTSVIFIIAAVYISIAAMALIFSNSMMFHPGASSYFDASGIIKIPLPDGTNISARYHENHNAQFTILFSHGNAEDMGDLSALMDEFVRRGFSVMAYDYNGYGTSSGSPTEQGTFKNIEAVYDYLTAVRKLPAERIIVWGRSIGSGPSVHLAATHPVGGVVIESGFTSAFRVVTRIRILPFDRFDNLAAIRSISSPLLVMHGRLDEVIPFRHGLKLFEAAQQPKMQLWVDRAGHNDLLDVAGESYWRAASEFTEKLRQR